MKALLGTKLGMTQIFDADGNIVQATVIAAGPCVVTQVKTDATDGYNAIQIGFGDAKHQKRPQMGHLKAANTNAKYLREVRLPDVDPTNKHAEAEVEAESNDLKLTVGTQIDVTTFEIGDKVQVTGTSKGKGFAGTVKRHNFATGPKTHGSHNYRAATHNTSSRACVWLAAWVVSKLRSRD
jgi:large subunit ribosomal protein L3